MKKLNLLVFFSFLMITGGIISSCQKEDQSTKEANTANTKNTMINCNECVEEWTDTQMIFDHTSFIPQSVNIQAPPQDLFVSAWNDETTVYFRIYRTNGTIQHLNIEGNIIVTYGGTPITEHSWTVPLTPGWTPCTVIESNIIVGGITVHGGHYNACIHYILRDMCEETTCTDETAWAAGPRYTQKGNWATYTPYVANTTVNIYAGQNILVGTVEMGPVVNGQVTLTINLINGSHFQNVTESLKIQGYASPPSGNPAPGQFANKFNATGSSIQVTVPAANYYGIHLDVVACR